MASHELLRQRVAEAYETGRREALDEAVEHVATAHSVAEAVERLRRLTADHSPELCRR